MRVVYFGLTVLLLCVTAGGQMRSPAPEASYTVAYASVAPLNTDIFIAAADGRDARADRVTGIAPIRSLNSVTFAPLPSLALEP